MEQKAIVSAPLCPLYNAPSFESERADEVLYGMAVTLLNAPCPGWRRVRTHYRYEGFAPEACLLIGDEAAARWASLPKQVVLHKNTCDVQAAPAVRSFPLLCPTRGALLSPVGAPEDGWQKVLLCDGRAGYARSGILDVYYETPPPEGEGTLRARLVRTAALYRGASYRWGGKSPLGIDCSGFTSMVYLLCGIVIWRDAQIKEGFPIRAICRTDMAPGDLLFFPGHVALYMGDGRYIHSTGAPGSDGVTVNSLDPACPLFRRDLFESLTAVGSWF